MKEQTEKVLPLSYRDNKPRIHAIRINSNRSNGLPNGVHCGAWYDMDTKKVWKSLYGRPYINADVIVRTHEDEFLNEFADLFYSPRNWEVKASNHLWWLVRDEAITLSENEYKDIDNDSILGIEQAIYKVNARGWSINDYITLLIDKSTYNLFIGDLSTACKDPQADDWNYIERFFKLCGRERFITLRNNARGILHNLRYNTILFGKDEKELPLEALMQYKHVYASFNRPISGLWASLPKDTLYRHEEHPNWSSESMTPWTWVVTKEPLSDEKIKSYELQWGWSDRR
jgi:hypothetical protein